MLNKMISVAVLTVAATNVHADKEALKLQETDISLTQAIEIAEKHVEGRAYEAELDKNSFGLEYEIDLIKEGTEHPMKIEVTIDAKSGEVLNQRSKRIKRKD